MPAWLIFACAYVALYLIVRSLRRFTGCTVAVEINGVVMRQIAGSLDDALATICKRWNKSEEHRRIATLTPSAGWVVPEMAPGVERVSFKMRIRD